MPRLVKPLVFQDGTSQATADTGGGGGGGAIYSVEVNLGSTPVRSGRFTITDATLSVGHQVYVHQSADLYTGKGTRTDEAEMDAIHARGTVATVGGSATVYWSSDTLVKGNVKFNYRSA